MLQSQKLLQSRLQAMPDAVICRAATSAQRPHRIGWLPLFAALLAMFSFSSLNAWHNSMPHVDGPAAMQTAADRGQVDHDHQPDRSSNDGKVDLHLGVHSVTGSLNSVDGQLSVMPSNPLHVTPWPAFADSDEGLAAFDPLLRPPRS
ncbi:MAG: hypothetical protein ACOY5R_01040 [Pseudomonadota bacterium]